MVNMLYLIYRHIAYLYFFMDISPTKSIVIHIHSNITLSMKKEFATASSFFVDTEIDTIFKIT